MAIVLYIVLAALPVVAMYRRLLKLRLGDTLFCKRCGYNLTGLHGQVCPECGNESSAGGVVKGVPAISNRLRQAIGLGILLSLLTGICAAICF